MPISRVSRQELREQARNGDIYAALLLIRRCRCKTVKGLLAQVCQFDVPVTPAIFDTCADAFALANNHQLEGAE